MKIRPSKEYKFEPHIDGERHMQWLPLLRTIFDMREEDDFSFTGMMYTFLEASQEALGDTPYHIRREDTIYYCRYFIQDFGTALHKLKVKGEVKHVGYAKYRIVR